MNIKIGLYKHKETGEFDVMIDSIDNRKKIHNGEFKKVEEFNYHEETKEEKLTKQLNSLQEELKWRYDNDLKPVIQQGKTSDSLDDEKINGLRDCLYNFMCKRRELVGVNEFKFTN